MDPIWIAALVVLTTAAAAGAAYSRSSAPAILGTPLSAVASALGLEPPEPETTVVQGFHAGAAVRIEGHLGSDDDPDFAVVTVTLARPTGLKARSEGLLPSFDFKTGDPAFDRSVKLAGEPMRLAGVLSAEVRALMTEAAKLRSFRLEGRQLSCHVPDLSHKTGQVIEAAHLLARLATTLRAQPERTEALLLHNVHVDPLVAVRRACALFLGDRAFVGSDEQHLLAEVLLHDPDLDLRLDGADIHPEDPRAQQVYLAALTARKAKHRVRAVEGLRCSGHPEAVAALTASIGDPDPEVTAAIAWALGEMGGRAVERVLLRLLGHPSADVKLAAAEGLGSQGGITSVERLLAVGAKGSRALQRATRQAVAEIQARAGKGEAGGLTVVEGEDAAGRLSEVEWGGLAVVDDK